MVIHEVTFVYFLCITAKMPFFFSFCELLCALTHLDELNFYIAMLINVCIHV